MYVIGIDGGGTKTKGAIASSDGEIMAESSVGPTNPNSAGQAGLEIEFTTLLDSLKKQNSEVFSQVTRVFAGMSGVGRPMVQKNMEQLIASLLTEDVDVTVENDAVTALYSGTLGNPGIVQIAGTGSITFGINGLDKRGRVGGWGHLIGEPGSGYELGSDALREVFLAHDGMKNAIELKELNERICEYFQVHSLPDIIHHVYQAKNVKEQIASLSKLVVESADNGDLIAEKIIQKHGLAMGESIACLAKKLFTNEERVRGIPVVLTGGLFNRLDLFKTSIEEKLYRTNINASLIRPEMEPVGGAIAAALQAEGIELQTDFPTIFQKH